MIVRKRVIFKILSVLTIVFFSFSVAGASWLDNWFQQYTSSTPDYYMGQKRGYVTFGSFSARTGLSSTPDPWITFETPRVWGGCGGIDLFLGGFSFVNPEYLVQRLQMLIQAAPVVAFELALKVLTSSLSDVTGKVQSVIDFLNQFQLNECKLFEPVYTVLKKDFSSVPKEQRLEAIWGNLTEGYSKMWTDLKKRLEGKPISKGELAAGSKNCPYTVEAIANAGGLLAYIASRTGIPKDLEDVVRALIGDVKIVKDCSSGECVYTGEWIYHGSSPAATLRLDVDSLKAVDRNGNQYQQSTNLKSFVINALLDGYRAKIDRRNPTSDNYIKCVQLSPIPLEHLTNLAVLMRDMSILHGAAPAVAAGILYNAFIHVHDMLTDMLYHIDVPAPAEGCQVLGFLGPALRDIRNDAQNVISAISQPYRVTLAELEASLSVSSQVLRFRDLVRGVALDKLSHANLRYLLMHL